MKGCILEDNLEGQEWQTTLFTILFVLTLMLRYFFKKRNIRKRVRGNWLRHFCTFCITISRKVHANPISFLLFFGIKGSSKCSTSFIPWLLNSFYLPSYGPHSKKRYRIRLLSICLRKSIHCIGAKVPTFDSLRWAHSASF